MSYICTLLEDYRDNPDTVGWYRPEWIPDDPELAAQYFMEVHGDPDGNFGSGETSQRQMEVLVWDELNKTAHLVVVYPRPRPAYNMEQMDEDAETYHGIDLTGIGEPDVAQISE